MRPFFGFSPECQQDVRSNGGQWKIVWNRGHQSLDASRVPGAPCQLLKMTNQEQHEAHRGAIRATTERGLRTTRFAGVPVALESGWFSTLMSVACQETSHKQQSDNATAVSQGHRDEGGPGGSQLSRGRRFSESASAGDPNLFLNSFTSLRCWAGGRWTLYLARGFLQLPLLIK